MCCQMRTAIALLKPRYHFSYAGVLLGALLFAKADAAVGAHLAALYISFNVLLYGGIYTLNDLADRAADAVHPEKRTRPIAAGRVTGKMAAFIGVSLVGSGLVTGAWLFPVPIVLAYLAVLAVNAAYSCGGRDLPCLDIALNSAPHAVRFLMGALLTDRLPPRGHVLAWFCLAAGIACVRRLVEKHASGEPSRPVLRFYSPRGLSRAADLGLGIILTLWLLDGGTSPGFYVIVTTAYLLLVVSARRSAHGQLGLEWLWLR